MLDPTERERGVADLLDRWPWQHGGVVIGGYAVAAYGAPRYSDDVDLVVPIAALKPLQEWLGSLHFVPEKVPEKPERNYAGKLARWRKDLITLDLIPGVVRDREAQVDIPEHWLGRNARRMRLVLIDTSTRTEIPVVRPEGFWATKLQAGRPRDLGDLFAIREEPVDLNEVKQLFKSLWCESLANKLQLVRTRLADEKLYADTISRLGRGSPSKPTNRRAWQTFQEKARRAMPTGS